MSFNLLNIFREKLEPSVIKQLVQLGEPENQSQTASDAILPAIVGSILAKASTQEGAKQLLERIQDPSYSHNIDSNADKALSQESVVQQLLETSGPATVSFLFQDNLEALARAVSMQAGTSESGSAKMLFLYTPLAMSVLRGIIDEHQLNEVPKLQPALIGQAAQLKGRLMDNLCYSLGWGTAGAFLGDVVNQLSGKAPTTQPTANPTDKDSEHKHTGKGDISKCPMHGGSSGNGITWPGQKVLPTPTLFQRWWWLIPVAIILLMLVKCGSGSDSATDHDNVSTKQPAANTSKTDVTDPAPANLKIENVPAKQPASQSRAVSSAIGESTTNEKTNK